MLYQIRIERPPTSNKNWVVNLALVKEPGNILGSSQKYRTIKDARSAADNYYPKLHWVNGRKAYLKSLEN